jgi:hypothetical protein
MFGPARSAYVGAMPITSADHEVVAMAARETCRQLVDHSHAAVKQGRASIAAELFTADRSGT